MTIGLQKSYKIFHFFSKNFQKVFLHRANLHIINIKMKEFDIKLRIQPMKLA